MTKITQQLTAMIVAALALPFAGSAAIINVDFNGVRTGDGSLTNQGPTYVGQAPAGGGTFWNGVLADSRTAVGSPDNDALTVTAENLKDSDGKSTAVGFTIGPVAAGNQGATPGTDPTSLDNLLLDWVLVGYFGETTGTADIAISGLGAAPTADLYFYHRGDFPGTYTFPGAVPSPFPSLGGLDAGHGQYFKNVPVTDGTITGTFSKQSATLALVSGFTVALPNPGPYVKATAPSGIGVAPDASAEIQVWDYVTQLNPSSVKVFVNDQPVTQVTTEHQPAGANYWTITAKPAGGFLEGVSNVVKVIFADTGTPAVSQTNVFGFVTTVAAEGHRAINIDINGWRGSESPAPTYTGQGVAGGGNVFNGVAADSTAGDDNLTVGATNLLDSIGSPTTVSFTLSPIAGENRSNSSDPTSRNTLFGDFAAVGFEGQDTGTSDFTITGLGVVPTVDLYFYTREDPLSDGAFAGSTYTLTNADAFPFPAHDIFNDGNTVYVKNVPVINGRVTGSFSGQVGGGGGEGSAAGALSGLTILTPLPQPYVRKALPKSDYVRPDAPVSIELQDYVTAVNTNSVSLSVNGQSVPATISKPAGSTVTTVTYTPPTGWIQEATNSMTITYGNNATPALVQTNTFTFFVISPLKASRIVNIDVNGVGHSTLPLGPTYVGSGAAGGGSVFNGVPARTRQPDGTDDDAITVTATNMVDSLGNPSPFAFTISPVGAGNSGAVGGQFSEKFSALNHDWLIVGYFGAAQEANFTISGLGKAPLANVYFYFREDPRENGRFGSGTYDLPGVSGRTPFAGRGVFADTNTTYFESVPVSNGTITGKWRSTSVLALMTGLTIELPLPHAILTSKAPEGGGVLTSVPITVQLSDFDVVQVDPKSIALSVNGVGVTPTISKPAGTNLTTVSYLPAGGWARGASNHVMIIFGDTAAPVLLQTNQFNFAVVNLAVATNVVNVDINGIRNGDGGIPELGATYSGQSPAGGGRIWSSVVVDSRLPDGQDDDEQMVNAGNLVDSAGNPTTLTFAIGPVAPGNQGAGSVPTDPLALYYDWVLVGYFGETVGTADFTIGGLGTNRTADLYFYNRGDFPGTWLIGDAHATPFTGTGTFDSAHVTYFKDVPITNGKITGQFTKGASTLGLVSGFTVAFPPPAGSQPARLTLARQANQITITWPGTGTLQSSEVINGTWTDMTGVTSPYSVTPAGSAKFYRLKQ